MRLMLLAMIATMIVPVVSHAQQREERGGGKREACREEARRAITPSRTSRMDRSHLQELRREYTRDCVRKSRSA